MKRATFVIAAALTIGAWLSGCSLLGGDTLARPDVVSVQLEAQCDSILSTATAINAEITEQFRKLDAGEAPSGKSVRELVDTLDAPAPTGPLLAAVDALTEQYKAIAAQLDTTTPDPAVIEEAGGKVTSYSEQLAIACS